MSASHVSGQREKDDQVPLEAAEPGEASPTQGKSAPVPSGDLGPRDTCTCPPQSPQMTLCPLGVAATPGLRLGPPSLLC